MKKKTKSYANFNKTKKKEMDKKREKKRWMEKK